MLNFLQKSYLNFLFYGKKAHIEVKYDKQSILVKLNTFLLPFVVITAKTIIITIIITSLIILIEITHIWYVSVQSYQDN